MGQHLHDKRHCRFPRVRRSGIVREPSLYEAKIFYARTDNAAQTSGMQASILHPAVSTVR